MAINIGKVGFTVKGEYNNLQLYERLDMVSYQGSSYVCHTDSSGILPINLSNWFLVALKGEKGDQGDQGYQGIQGETGDAFVYEDFTPEQLIALKGEKGDQGIQGETGADGTSPYDIAVIGGYSGTETEFNFALSNVGDISNVVDIFNGEEI